jgi:hypothetical protein
MAIRYRKLLNQSVTTCYHQQTIRQHDLRQTDKLFAFTGIKVGISKTYFPFSQEFRDVLSTNYENQSTIKLGHSYL